MTILGKLCIHTCNNLLLLKKSYCGKITVKCQERLKVLVLHPGHKQEYLCIDIEVDGYLYGYKKKKKKINGILEL